MSPTVAQNIANLAIRDGANGEGLPNIASVAAKGWWKQNAYRDFMNKPKPTKISSAMTLINDVPMLGTDLRNDHPVSIQYAGGGCNSAAACGPTNFNDADFNTASYASINGNDAWYVDVDASTTRDKGDMILYTRTDGPGANSEPFVECASCHDPHNVTGGATDVQFLRISNAGSAVCLACHNK